MNDLLASILAALETAGLSTTRTRGVGYFDVRDATGLTITTPRARVRYEDDYAGLAQLRAKAADARAALSRAGFRVSSSCEIGEILVHPAGPEPSLGDLVVS